MVRSLFIVCFLPLLAASDIVGLDGSLVLPPGRGASDSGRAIPRIIHQNFMGGAKELRRIATQTASSPFRKEWWLSCRTHNPGWKHVLWSHADCERLLDQQYPWFLSTWRNYSSIVMKSDSIRYFILHAYGGVYLDLDTECLSALDESVQGHSLVLTAEDATEARLNNAQMASTRGHPIWDDVGKGLVEAAKKPGNDVLEKTGPAFITDAFRAYTRIQHSLVGDHADQSSSAGLTIKVFGVGQWFTPCVWDDIGCMVRFAQERPALIGQPFAESKLVGTHHFRGSWKCDDKCTSSVNIALEVCKECHHRLGCFEIDLSNTSSPRRLIPLPFANLSQSMNGVVAFFSNTTTFSKTYCDNKRVLGFATSLQHVVCWDSVAADIASKKCFVVSFREGVNTSNPEAFTLEAALATAGCTVHVFSDAQHVRAHGQNAGSLHHHYSVLRQEDDPFTLPAPATSLRSALQAVGASHITILSLQCQEFVFDVVNQLYLHSSVYLLRVQQLLVELPLPPAQWRMHKAHAMFQHLVQEVGFTGMAHAHVDGSWHSNRSTVQVRLTMTRNLTAGGLSRRWDRLKPS